MGHPKLPPGVEGAFRIVAVDGFERRFTIHIYGAGRAGWSIASYRSGRITADTGMCPLPKGEWLILRHHAERAGFWSLPVTAAHLNDPDFLTLDGGTFTITGRIGELSHQITRDHDWEPGLNAIFGFAYRISGFYARSGPGGFWRLSIGPKVAPLPTTEPPDGLG